MKSKTTIIGITYTTPNGDDRYYTRQLFRAWRSKYERHIGKKQLSKKTRP